MLGVQVLVKKKSKKIISQNLGPQVRAAGGVGALRLRVGRAERGSEAIPHTMETIFCNQLRSSEKPPLTPCFRGGRKQGRVFS